MTDQQDHVTRLSTVEARTASLEKWTEDFGASYERDRNENRDNFQRIFTGIEALKSAMASSEASKGHIPTRVILTLVFGLPAIVVPICSILAFFVMQTVSPLSELQQDDHRELVRQSQVQVDILVNQARIDERQKFILEKTNPNKP